MAFTGIYFNGKHSYEDLHLTLRPERDIGFPKKKKYVQSLPFSSDVIDFSMLYGGQSYEERTITYKFNVMREPLQTKADMNILKTKIVNWLYGSNGKQILKDDNIPGFYFMAEVQGDVTFEEEWWYGVLTVTFVANPRMYREVLADSDLWNDFMFDFDVSQKTEFLVQSDWSRFNQLNIGDVGTLGAWATDFGGGVNISPSILGRSYNITGKKEAVQSASKWQYYVPELGAWVLEQDFLEAQVKYEVEVLVNNGTVNLTPEITTTDKLTIVKDNQIFNFLAGTYKDDLFQLKPGMNNLTMYAHAPANVKFNFRMEVI